MNYKAAVEAIESVGTEALKDAGLDASEAADAAKEYVQQLEPDVEQATEALAQASTTGDDTQTWVNALTAGLDAAALRTVNLIDALTAKEVTRLRDVAMGALVTAIKIALV